MKKTHSIMKKNYLLIIIVAIFTLSSIYCNNSKPDEDNLIEEDIIQKDTVIDETLTNNDELNIEFNYDNIPDSILQNYKYMLLDTNIIFLKNSKLYVYYSDNEDKELFYEGIPIRDFILSDDKQNIILLSSKEKQMSLYSLPFEKNAQETHLKTISFSEFKNYCDYDISDYKYIEFFAGNLIEANSNKIIFIFLIHEMGMDGSFPAFLSMQINTKKIEKIDAPVFLEEVLSEKAQKLKKQLIVHEQQLCILKNNDTIKFTDSIIGYGYIYSISPDATKIYYSYESSWGVGPINTSYIINSDGTNFSFVRKEYIFYESWDENIIWHKNGNLILFDDNITFIYGYENEIVVVEPEVMKFEVF